MTTITFLGVVAKWAAFAAALCLALYLAVSLYERWVNRRRK